METKIETFNWDLKWFLSHLETFRKTLNTSNDDTLSLLDKISDSIEKIVGKSKKFETKEKTDIIDWVTINEDVFEFQRWISCRACGKSFPATCREYILHVASGEHNSILVKYSNECNRLSQMSSKGPAVKQEKSSNVSKSTSIELLSNSFNETSDRSNSNERIDVKPEVSELPKKIKREREFLNVQINHSKPDVPKGAASSSDDQSDSDSDISIRSVPKRTYSIESDNSVEENVTLNSKRLDNSASDQNETDAARILSGKPSRKRSHSTKSDSSSNNVPTKKVCTVSSNLNAIDVIQTSKPREKPLKCKPLFVCNLGIFVKEYLQHGLKESLQNKETNALNQSTKHKSVTDSVEKLLRKQFEMMKCHLLGSRVNGTIFVRDNTPLDIYLELSPKHFGQGPYTKKISASMLTVYDLLEKNSGWTQVQKWQTKNCRFITAKHTATELTCQFMFSSGALLRQNELIKSFFAVQELCCQIVFCVRMSLEKLFKTRTNRENKFTGYMISLLVIFYFQTTNRLPSVRTLQKGCLERVADNNVAFEQPSVRWSSCTDSLGTLLIGFFEFYSTFEFEKSIISVYEGIAINHNIRKANDDSLSRSLRWFKDHLVSNKSSERVWSQSVMCVQDIFLHRQNVTEVIDLIAIELFKKFCALSLETLRDSGESIQF